jgi:hypothetical protein
MSTATTTSTETALLIYHRNFRSLALQPGGTVMYAYLSLNEGIGPDRSHGTVAGHISLKQSGVKPGSPDVGDFIVSGTFSKLGIEPIEPPQPFTFISFESVNTLIGQQTLRGHAVLSPNGKTGGITFNYTPEGGHPLITVANAQIEAIPLKS